MCAKWPKGCIRSVYLDRPVDGAGLLQRGDGERRAGQRERESAVVQPIVWSGYRDDVTFCNAHTIRRQEIERRAVMMQEHRV